MLQAATGVSSPSVDTTGSGGAWINFFTIPITSTEANAGTLIVTLPQVAWRANNGAGNYQWSAHLAIAGNEVSPSGSPSLYPTYKFYSHVGSPDYQYGTIAISDVFILKNGIDYSTSGSSTSLKVYVSGIANNPIASVEYSFVPSNIQILSFT